MNYLSEDTLLVVIDMQQAFDNPKWGQRNNLSAEANIAQLLASWREAKRQVMHVHHRNPKPNSLFNPDSSGIVAKPEALPLEGEPVLFKNVNSAFIGTDLEQRLRAIGATTLVVVGMTTDHCVSTTTRMAGNFGFDTFIVSDATATFDRSGPDGKYYPAQLMHDTALASLNGEFAEVVSTAQVLQALAAK